MDQAAADDLMGATGLALAVVAALIERETPIPKGEVGRCLALMAEAADPAAPHQREILATWAKLVSAADRAN